MVSGFRICLLFSAKAVLAVKVELLRLLNCLAFRISSLLHPLLVERPDCAAMMAVWTTFNVAMEEEVVIRWFGHFHARQDCWDLVWFQSVNQFWCDEDDQFGFVS